MRWLHNPTDAPISFQHRGGIITIPVGNSGPWPVELARRAALKFYASYGVVSLTCPPMDPSAEEEGAPKPEPPPAEPTPDPEDPPDEPKEEASTRRGRAAKARGK